MIQSILFDWDGTLLNSNQLINESNQFVLNKYGGRIFTDEEIKEFNGPSLIDAYRQVNVDKAEEMVKAYRVHSDSRHDQMVQLFPGVKEVLIELDSQGVSLGVVSMKRGKIVRQGISLFGLEDLFKVVIGGDECEYKKPHSEPIEKALRKLNASNETSLMVGDNWHDIEAANQANIRSAFVEWSQKKFDEVAQYRPDYVLKSMASLIDLTNKY